MGELLPTRRATLMWLTAAIAAGCSRDTGAGDVPVRESARKLHGLEPAAKISGETYGFDPDRLMPSVPWSLTMSEPQLAVTAKLSALIVPEEGRGAAADKPGTEYYVDEWVSAPYPEQKQDRTAILPLLDTVEADCRDRFDVSAVDASAEQLQAILDEFAWSDRIAEGREKDAAAFSRLRRIVVGVYATSEAGRADLGYLGNRPILGPYPGPTDEALQHLRGALQGIGLAL